MKKNIKVSLLVLGLVLGIEAQSAKPKRTERTNNNKKMQRAGSVSAPSGALTTAAPVVITETISFAEMEEVEAVKASLKVQAEIKDRYATSYNNAKGVCSNLAGKINQVKIMAGISTGASGLGTLAAGAALTTGLIKHKTDKEIDVIEKDIATHRLTESDVEKMTPTEVVKKLNEMSDYINSKNTQIAKKKSISQNLGVARTATSFVAGGTSVTSAVTSFVGVSQLDQLIKDMNACDSYIREIKGQRAELMAEDSTDTATIAQMETIIKDCSGLNSRNIGDIKVKMTASGVVSSVGAATGIAGGITSTIAGTKEKKGASAVGLGKDGGTKELNLASNILAGVTTGTSLTSTVLGGVTLSDLEKNAEVANKCKEVF